MKLTNYSILIIITLSIFSCKKDKKNDCSLTEANLAGSYKISSAKYKATPTSTEIDGTTLFDPCALDDITTFNTNHTYIYTDAGTKCDPAGDDAGTWALSGSNITVNSDTEPIKSFDCTYLVIAESDVEMQGDLLTVTLKKQ